MCNSCFFACLESFLLDKGKKITFSLFLEQNFYDEGKQKLLKKSSIDISQTFMFSSQLGARYRINISEPDEMEITLFAEVTRGHK